MRVLRKRALLRWEMQNALSARVRGKPVLPIDLLVVRRKWRRKIRVAGPGVLRHIQTIYQHDLQVLLVRPDLALEVAVTLHQLLRGNIENIGIQVVDLLFAEVRQVVLGQLRRSQDEGQSLLDVVDIVLSKDDVLQRVARREDDMLYPMVRVVIGNIGHLLPLPIWTMGVVIDGVHLHGLSEGVAVPCVLKRGLFRAHPLDNLRHRDAGRLCVFERPETSDVGGRGGGFLRVEHSSEGKREEEHKAERTESHGATGVDAAEQRKAARRDTGRMSFGRSRTAKPPLDEGGLLEYAVKSLASRMKSERDLRRLMAQRATPGEEGSQAIDAVMVKLRELGYLSDERFAADYTRLRQENEKFGRRRVQQGLMQKGVASTLVNEAVGKAYEEVDEVALARSYAERKRMRKPENEKETARAMRRLMAAGFSSKAIWAVLRSWGKAVDEVDIAADED